MENVIPALNFWLWTFNSVSFRYRFDVVCGFWIDCGDLREMDFFVCKSDVENFANSDLRWVGRLVGSSVGGLHLIVGSFHRKLGACLC